MVTIYSAQGTERYRTPVNEGSKRVYKLMGDDYVTLKFSASAPVVFRIGDWCVLPDYGRFMVCEPYYPSFNKQTKGYDYELKLEAQYRIWRNKIMRYMPDYGGSETAWELTATAEEHLLCVLTSVNALAHTPQVDEYGNLRHYESGEKAGQVVYVDNPLFKYNGTELWDFVYDDTVEGSAKTLKYESVNMIDALTMIAEAYDCEWWVEGKTVHLGRCEKRETRYIDFELGKNVAEMSQTNSKSDFVTRLIPFGSERNISPRYRKDLIFTVDMERESGNEICDTTRILRPSYFDQVPLPSEEKMKLCDVAPTSKTYIVKHSSRDSGTETVGVYREGWSAQTSDEWIPAEKYTIDFSEFHPVVSLYDFGGSALGVNVELDVQYSGKSVTAGAFTKVVTIASQSENRVTTFSGESQILTTSFKDTTLTFEGDVWQISFILKVTAEFQGGTAPNPTNNYMHVDVDGYNKSSVYINWNVDGSVLDPKVEGITVQKIDSRGNEIARYADCVFNPYSVGADGSSGVGDTDWVANAKKRSIIRLPYGVTMHIGDRFRILEINREDVKSSYFTNRYAAYDDTSYVSLHGIVTKRLMLPEDEKPYVQLDDTLDDTSVVEKVQIFDDIYPKALATITDVQEVVRYEEVPNDDGTTTKRAYTAYIVTDDIFSESRPFRSKYILENDELEGYFQDSRIYEEGDTDIPEGKKVGDRYDNKGGLLNGFSFKMVYKDNDEKRGKFEIVRDDTSLVPNEVLRPKVGDQFVLCNYNIAAIEEVYVFEAEQKLLQKAREYLRKDNEDPSIYECTLMPDYARENKFYPYAGRVDAIANPDYLIGTRINLLNDAYVPSAMGTDESDRLPDGTLPERLWGRKSRIIGYELNIDIPWDNPVYHVGEKPSYSKLGEISDKVAELKITADNMSALVSRYDKSRRNAQSNGSEQYYDESDDTLKAAYADYAYEAYLLDPDSPERNNFLKRNQPDTAFGRITFSEGLNSSKVAGLAEGFNVGTFLAGMSGAGMDSLGNAEVESLKIRSYLEVVELIINRLAAIEGDQILTEADTIESVEEDGVNNEGLPQYILHFKRPYEGYFTAQYEGNILKGIVNTLANAVLNHGTAADGTAPAEYYTSWMLVTSVNAPDNSCTVVLYADKDVPAGKNFPPCELMKVARWGNVGNTEAQKKRQSCLFLSSTEGRIVRLRDVTKPIIGTENYASTFGRCPEFLTTATDKDGNPLPVVAGDDYLYAKGIVVENIIKYDHEGMPEPTYVERGYWEADAQYFCKGQNEDTGVFETSLVYHKGCKYQCIRTHTSESGQEPGWGSLNWIMIVGDPSFHVDFVESEGLFDPLTFNTTLTIVATLHNQDITADIRDEDVIWTRESQDHTGVANTADDNAWAIAHASTGKQLSLSSSDVPGLSQGFVPKKLIYTATVTLRDNQGEQVAQDTISIGY